MQTEKAKKENLGLQSYYKGLNNKDKTKLIGYLMNRFGWSYNSAWNRLTGRTQFSEIELLVIIPIINNEQWNQ